MKTKRTLYVRELKFGVILLDLSFLYLPLVAIAQEDVTAPVLLEFSILPVIFDSGPAPVLLRFCATALMIYLDLIF